MIEAIILFAFWFNVEHKIAINVEMDKPTYCREVLMKLPTQYKNTYKGVCNEK